MNRIAERLFLTPPFPGAKPFAMLATGPARAVAPAEADALVAAIARERVGGPFWSSDADPWSRFAADTIFTTTADDPLALLATIAGCRVSCPGEGPFSGLSGRAQREPDHRQRVRDLVVVHMLREIRWHDPLTGEPADPVHVIARLGAWRRLIEANRRIAAAFGFAGWKQDTTAALLWDGERAPPFHAATNVALDRLPHEATVAIWKARVPPAFLHRLEQSGRSILEIEDGFIRSIGLGADCVPPLSIVVDDLGAHYDPSSPSRLEHMIADADMDAAMLSRAAALRRAIVASGISKYGVGGAALARPAGTRRHVLVVGQVEDDRSVRLGGCGLASNLELLRRVRARCPDAYILYRPHPDVEAGHRTGRIAPVDMLALADATDRDSAISDLVAMVDEVHVLTSLAGFEALLHGKAVVTHGVPFYAGWGLTTDLGPVPARRTVPRTLDHLVAAVLIAYPRYLDPTTGLPCDVELLIRRMGAGVRRENAALVALRRVWGMVNRAGARLRNRV
jgi:capsular polysaccharide export protein